MGAAEQTRNHRTRQRVAREDPIATRERERDLRFPAQSSASTWRTRLLAITTEADEVEPELVPAYYDPEDHHSLWVKVTDFEQVEPSEITEGYVLANSGDPVTAGGLGNQGPLIIRRQSSTLPGRFFILNQLLEQWRSAIRRRRGRALPLDRQVIGR